MTKVKICGITNKEDAALASKDGADYIGFIFFEKSPRHVMPQEAKEIVKCVPEKIKKVGVFVNEEPGNILETVKSAGLDVVQLHSVINENTYDKLKWAKIPYLRVFRVKGELPYYDFIEDKDCYGYLFDSYSESAFGGTGKRFDWEIVKELSKVQKVFLSGGLDENNVCEAIRTVKPYAVDVSSGIEKSAGKKDGLTMELFIRNAKKCM